MFVKKSFVVFNRIENTYNKPTIFNILLNTSMSFIDSLYAYNNIGAIFMGPIYYFISGMKIKGMQMIIMQLLINSIFMGICGAFDPHNFNDYLELCILIVSIPPIIMANYDKYRTIKYKEIGYNIPVFRNMSKSECLIVLIISSIIFIMATAIAIHNGIEALEGFDPNYMPFSNIK